MYILRVTLVAVLVLSGLIQLVLGIQVFVNFEKVSKKFGLSIDKIHPDFNSIKVLATMLGKFLLNFFVISIITAFFVYHGNPAGRVLSMFFGITMIIGGITSVLKGGGTAFVYIDSLRGLIILILSLIV